MANDEADVGGTQESACVAEFRRVADATGRRVLRAFLHQLVDRPVGRARGFLEPTAQAIRQKRPWQDVVDNDVVPGDLTRQTGDETGEAGARAVAHAEFRDG